MFGHRYKASKDCLSLMGEILYLGFDIGQKISHFVRWDRSGDSLRFMDSSIRSRFGRGNVVVSAIFTALSNGVGKRV